MERGLHAGPRPLPYHPTQQPMVYRSLLLLAALSAVAAAGCARSSTQPEDAVNKIEITFEHNPAKVGEVIAATATAYDRDGHVVDCGDQPFFWSADHPLAVQVSNTGNQAVIRVIAASTSNIYATVGRITGKANLTTTP